MGITSPMRPAELANPDGLSDDAKAGVDVTVEDVNLAAFYMRTLEIPRRAGSALGAALFEEVRCGACHVASLRTRDDYPIAGLAGIDAPVFTDFLLHDMGPELADAMTDGDARGSEWRTAPLIGLRHNRTFLHDGRATSVEEAILQHTGEAADSTQRYQALSQKDHDTLLEFVEGL